MKKLIKLAFVASLAFGVAACGSNGEVEQTEHSEHADHAGHDHEGHDHGTENKESISGNFIMDTDNSEVLWSGGMTKISGVQLYSHSGTIDITAGKMIVENGELVAGKIIIDMTSIRPTDENYDEKNTAKDLIVHLNSPDFFHVEKFPEATFNFEHIPAGDPILGKMTIRGITNEATLENVYLDQTDGQVTLKGNITIDRQQYEAAFDMGAKDKVVSDDIELSFKIVSVANKK